MINRKSRKVVILGAGLGGLSAAWHLQKKGVDCVLFEKEKDVGGLCRSKNINGFTFDCDGHLLHFKNKNVLNLVAALLGNNLCEHNRDARIYCCDRYIPYPFQANFHSLPVRVANECLRGLISVIGNGAHKKKNSNFLEWINNNFGKGIAEHFMVPYNLKFWTLPLRRLTYEKISDFIPAISLERMLKGVDLRKSSGLGYNSRFWYPKNGGISQLPLAFARQIKNIFVNSPVSNIDLRKKEVRFSNGRREEYDFLISTIPLVEMLGLIKNIPAKVMSSFKKLRWNSIFNLNLGIDKKDNHAFHWSYFPSNDLCFFRIGFFNNISGQLAPRGRTSLYVEVAYSQYKPIDKKNIVSRIKKDLIKIGIFSKLERIYAQDINDIKYGYPIYDKNYGLAVRNIFNFLNKNCIIPCGRYGSWRYMSMEESILDGKIVAENLN